MKSCFQEEQTTYPARWKSSRHHSLKAYVVLDGMDPGPGDKVIVHDAPTKIRFGERGTFRCHASIIHAGPFTRQATRILSYFELTELYEIGFSTGSAS